MQDSNMEVNNDIRFYKHIDTGSESEEEETSEIQYDEIK